MQGRLLHSMVASILAPLQVFTMPEIRVLIWMLPYKERVISFIMPPGRPLPSMDPWRFLIAEFLSTMEPLSVKLFFSIVERLFVSAPRRFPVLRPCKIMPRILSLFPRESHASATVPPLSAMPRSHPVRRYRSARIRSDQSRSRRGWSCYRLSQLPGLSFGSGDSSSIAIIQWQCFGWAGQSSLGDRMWEKMSGRVCHRTQHWWRSFWSHWWSGCK